MIMLVLIASMNRVTPVLANETKASANIYVTVPCQEKSGLEIQIYKRKIV